MKSIFIFAAILTSGFSLRAQPPDRSTNLMDFARQKQEEWRVNRTQAESFARQRGLPIREELATGTIIEIVKIKDGIPVYVITENAGAAATTRADQLWPGGILGLNLSGNGYDKLAVWDGGGVLETHQEFGIRVSQQDSPSSMSDHATHVSGTMIAAGVDAAAKGMAYAAELLAYDWSNDQSEMAAAAASGIEISNHSYGYISGWYTGTTPPIWYGNTSVSSDEDYQFGFYGSEAQDWDQIAYNAPYYLIVKSAGNDRGEYSTSNHRHAGSMSLFNDTHPPDGGTDGFDCISYMGVSKNILTVGAAAGITDYQGPSDVVIASFSGRGPTDDGRIKPDIVAKGINVYSTFSTSNSAYGTYSGTSMSSPNVAGTLVLLQQHYQNLNSGTSMRSATLKALIIHTADEAGNSPGPDYTYGWGLLNAARAAGKITENETQNVVAENSLSDGSANARDITVNAGTPYLKVTLVWTDPPGTPLTAQLDPVAPMLVNDLDLRINGNGTTYYPWRLNGASPSQAATNNGENNVDNVEEVLIQNPAAGNYTIIVDHDGSLSGGSQNYSLVISGIDAYSNPPSTCPSSLLIPEDGAANVSLSTMLRWTPVPDASSYDVYFGTDGGGSITPSNMANGLNQVSNTYGPALQGNTTYYLQVFPRNNQGVNNSCSVIWSFTTADEAVITSFPYSENFDGFETNWSLNSWFQDNDDDFDWSVNTGSTPSSGTGPNADHTSASGQYLYTESSDPNYPNKRATLLSPLFNLNGLPNPALEFWYHMYEDPAASSGQMGVLHVDVFAGGEWYMDVMRISGNQGNQWWPAVVDLSDYNTSFVSRIRFRGVTGIGWHSDIAIDDFSLRGNMYFTYLAGNTSAHLFPNTNLTVQFRSPNSGDVTLEAFRHDQNPGIVGSLPEGIDNILSQRYWAVNVLAGTVDGIYTLMIDLEGVGGIADYAALSLLKRADSSSPWQEAGTNNYTGSGTTVAWEGITSGFSEFTIGGAGDNSLPVSLREFQAKQENNTVILSWRTESELENLGFILLRREKEQSNWTEIAHYSEDLQLAGQGNSAEPRLYRFKDTDLEERCTYEYKLADVSFDGEVTYHEIIEIRIEPYTLPDSYRLENAAPNPFNPVTVISYRIPADSETNLSIYNLLGQKVATLVKGNQPAGSYKVSWNAAGFAAGIYYYHLKANHFSEIKKVILLK